MVKEKLLSYRGVVDHVIQGYIWLLSIIVRKIDCQKQKNNLFIDQSGAVIILVQLYYNFNHSLSFTRYSKYFYGLRLHAKAV